VQRCFPQARSLCSYSDLKIAPELFVELAKLIEDGRTVLGWLWLFHNWLPWSEAALSQPLFNFLAHPYGMAVNYKKDTTT
jgi:hypothetical protein